VTHGKRSAGRFKVQSTTHVRTSSYQSGWRISAGGILGVVHEEEQWYQMKPDLERKLCLFVVMFWLIGYTTLVLVGKTLGVGG